MATIIDYLSESGYEGYTAGLYTPYTRLGQSFTGSNGIINSAKFYILRSGNPSGNLYAKIYTHYGTFGTSSVPGTLIATSDAISTSSVGTSISLVTFTFSGAEKIALTEGTKYVLTIELIGTSDSSNKISVADDYPTLSHSGNASRYYSFGGTWTAYSSDDLIFYVYKEDPATKTHTIDGVLFAHQTKTHTIDAVIEDSESGDPIRQEDNFYILQEDGIGRILDQSNLRSPQVTNTVDGIIKETFTETNTIDSIVKVRGNEETHTIDGSVKSAITHTVDAYIRDTLTETHTADGIVVNRNSATHTLDGYVKATQSKTATIDGIIMAVSYSTATIDAIVVDRLQTTHTIDAGIKATNTAQFTIGGRIRIYWENTTKPTTNYNQINKPITSYTNRSKPSTIWTDVERPV